MGRRQREAARRAPAGHDSSRTEQSSAAVQPGAHTQTPGFWQTPCAHPGGQSASSHAAPAQPAAQSHTPGTVQVPRGPHGQAGSVQT